MESSNKTVLITGASGFIGLNTVKAFLSTDFTVYAMVHNKISEELIGFTQLKLIKADITDEKSIIRALNGIKPDIVVHIAGRVTDIGADKEFCRVNFEPVKFLSNLGAGKFIYISSTDVYGIKDFNGEDEQTLDFDEKPINPYQKYKIECEKWIKNNLHKSKYVIIRPGAVFGKGDETLESRVIEFLRVSPFMVYFGRWRGHNRWPLANVENVVNVILVVALIDEFNGETINIIDEKITTIAEYYHDIAQRYFPGKKFHSLFLPFWIGKIIGFISTFVSNLFKLEKPLFEPTYYAVHHTGFNLDFSSEKMKLVLNSLK